MLQSIFQWFQRRSSQATPAPTYHTSEHGLHYVKIPIIVATLDDDACPLLDNILMEDLGCGEIRKIAGEGDEWWDFTYKGTRFTAMLLVAGCGGSEIYPSSCTRSTAEERMLLRELVDEIVRHALQRTT